MIALRSVSFRYRGAPGDALADLSLSIDEGKLVAVLGATGAGKSTLCRLLNGIVPELLRGELRGEVVVAGRNRARVAELSGVVAMVFQDFESQLFTTEVSLEVAFGPESYGVPPDEIERRVRSSLARVGLAGFEGRAPEALSGGEKQRLAIAAALALEPRVLVLDEPLTDLDPVGKADVMRVLRELRAEGRTIVVVEHETEELACADRVIVLDRGRIAREGGREVLAEGAALAELGVRPPDLPLLFGRLGLDPKDAPIDDAPEAARQLITAGFTTDSSGLTEKGLTLLSPAIQANNLSHTYEGRPRPALSGVSLSIAAGEFLAILGGNGSGKSTLARFLSGLLPGDVALAGRPVSEMKRAAIAREVGYVFQNPDHQIFSATVEEEVAFGPRNFDLEPIVVRGRVAAALETVGLSGREAADPFALGKGDRQRLAVASVLSMEPRVIIMDEPTTGLDYRDQRRMLALLARLNEAGRTIIVITHHIWIAVEYARRVVLLSEGKIVADGPVRDVMADRAALERARVVPPPIVRLGWEMGGVFRTVEEAASRLRRP